MVGETVQLTIFRYDPESGEKPAFQEYQIPYRPHMTILDTLIYVYENLDGTLAFIYGCRYGSCGTCAVKVNGTPKLVCKELAVQAMKIEPLDNFPVIRDLVVDRSEFYERTRRVRPFLERGPGKIVQPEPLQPAAFEDFRHVYQCIECLACDSVCPSLKEDPYQFSGPALFVQLGRKVLDPRDRMDRNHMAYSEGLYHCLKCKNCTEVCPYGVDIPGVIIKKIRENALAKGLLPPEMGAVIQEMGRHGKPFSTRRVSRSAFVAQKPPLVKQQKPAGEVALFLGCNIEYQPWLVQTGKSVVDLLQNKLSYNVKIPEGLLCCGLPILEAGSQEKFKEAVVKDVALLEATGATEVVTPCPGCAMTMKKEWLEVFQEVEGRKPRFGVYEFAEYCLDRIPAEKMKEQRLKVTYHEPCHSNRYLGLSAKVRELIRKLPGVELKEMREPARCCGGGGEVMVVNPDLAFSLADKKADRILEAGVDAVVTNCPTCLMQMSRALSRRKVKKIQALHLTTLVNQALA